MGIPRLSLMPSQKALYCRRCSLCLFLTFRRKCVAQVCSYVIVGFWFLNEDLSNLWVIFTVLLECLECSGLSCGWFVIAGTLVAGTRCALQKPAPTLSDIKPCGTPVVPSRARGQWAFSTPWRLIQRAELCTGLLTTRIQWGHDEIYEYVILNFILWKLYSYVSLHPFMTSNFSTLTYI